MNLRRRKERDNSATTGQEDKGAGTSDARTSAARSAAHKQTSSGSQAEDAVVGAAVRGGSLLMLLALVQRASTFILNILLQRAMLSGVDSSSSGQTGRTTSALEEYGAASITLELISSTALFLAREPFRVALARSRVPVDASASTEGTANGASRIKYEDKKEAYRQRFVNTAWLSAPVGVAFAAVVRLAYPWIIRNDAFHGVPENRQAATLVCLAAALELLCEPLALIFQHRLLVDVRASWRPAFLTPAVRAEAAAVLVLGVARYLLVTRARLGVLSFGYAQLLHSATLATAYLISAARDIARASAKPIRDATTNEALEKATEAEGSLTDRVVTGVRGWLPQRPRLSRCAESNHVAVSEWVDLGQLRLAGTLAGQSVLKHVLTEGDKIVLARATGIGRACDDDINGGSSSSAGSGAGRGCDHGGSLYEQGVYAIASGYGSLVARMLFQPLEEAARLMFSKLGAEEGTASEFEATSVPSGQKAMETMQIYKSSGGGGDGRRLRGKMATFLATLLKLVLSAGLVFVCFGFHYTETLLRLLLATRRGSDGGGSGGSFAVSEVARVLSWYCVYVLFLAANGMCEAFACAVARGRQLTGMGTGLVASFAAFWALVGPLTGRFGTRGLVMANAAGMACRVVVSVAFIRRFFLQASPVAPQREDPGIGSDRSSTDAPPISANVNISTPRERNLWREVVAGALPHPAVLGAMAVSFAVAHASSPAASSPWDIAAASRHVLVVVLCLVLTGVLFARFEEKFLRELRGLWAARRARPMSAQDPGSGNDFDGQQKVD